jgi:hypothetical protein
MPAKQHFKTKFFLKITFFGLWASYQQVIYGWQTGQFLLFGCPEMEITKNKNL